MQMFQRNDSERIFILLLFTHMKMKKMLLGAFLGMFALAGVAVLPNYASATDGGNERFTSDSDAEFEALFENTEGVQTHNYLTWKGSAWATWLKAIKRAINMFMALLATVAVAVAIYAWFLMITASGDEKKYQKGISVLKYAAIGIAVVGLSWIIVSLVFRFVNKASGDTGTVTTNTPTSMTSS